MTSGEGGSPNMKNLMNEAMRRTTDNWPRRRPCVKESLEKNELAKKYERFKAYEDSTLGISAVDMAIVSNHCFNRAFRLDLRIVVL